MIKTHRMASKTHPLRQAAAALACIAGLMLLPMVNLACLRPCQVHRSIGCCQPGRPMPMAGMRNFPSAPVRPKAAACKSMPCGMLPAAPAGLGILTSQSDVSASQSAIFFAITSGSGFGSTTHPVLSTPLPSRECSFRLAAPILRI